MKKSLIIIGIIFAVVMIIYFVPESNIVDVKYQDVDVDLSTYDYLDTTKSSFINGAWYEESDGVLILQLNDEYYQYCEVPEEIWSDFSNADSFGSFYSSFIKEKYGCLEVNNTDVDDDCLLQASDQGNVYLESHGYTENDDGSWIDKNGAYPSATFEIELEEYQTSVYNDCLKGE